MANWLKRIGQYFREFDPVKFSLDSITVLAIISLVIQFILRTDIRAATWLADLYKVILPICAGYYEFNRWGTGQNREEPFAKRPRIVQGEYYVAAWTIVTVVILFLEVILFNYFPAKPADLITITSEVWGVFIISTGSKQGHAIRDSFKPETPAKSEDKKDVV
jgi:hypothetical protein